MIHREIQDGVLLLRMEHGKANALDVELCEELAEVFSAASIAPAKALVLTGSGTIFGAGVDLFRALEGGAPYLERFLPALVRALRAAFTCPRPLVAAVNGHAIAGGCLLAATADLRLMAEGNGRIGVPEIAVGVAFPLIALEILRARLPLAHLHEVVLGAGTFAPQEALARGLIDRIEPSDALLSRALAAARALSQGSAVAYAAAKQALRAPYLARVDAEGAAHDAAAFALWRSPETHAAIRASLERSVRRRG